MITFNTTYQQTKRVVDPGWGIYQTVLTINPSVLIVGTYNCTVENTRGRSSMIVIIGELISIYALINCSYVVCPHCMYLPTDYQLLVIGQSPYPVVFVAYCMGTRLSVDSKVNCATLISYLLIPLHSIAAQLENNYLRILYTICSC